MRQLDYDSSTGMETLFHYDSLTDQTTLEYRQHGLDWQADLAQQMHRERAEQGGKLKDYEWYAHIPDWLQMKWFTELGVKVWDKADEKKVWSLINSPEYSKFKIANFYHRPK